MAIKWETSDAEAIERHPLVLELFELVASPRAAERPSLKPVLERAKAISAPAEARRVLNDLVTLAYFLAEKAGEPEKANKVVEVIRRAAPSLLPLLGDTRGAQTLRKEVDRLTSGGVNQGLQAGLKPAAGVLGVGLRRKR